MRLYLFHLMIVVATGISFYFADVGVPFGCCRGPREYPNQNNNSQEQPGDENPKQGHLRRGPRTIHKAVAVKKAKTTAVCRETRRQQVCDG